MALFAQHRFRLSSSKMLWLATVILNKWILYFFVIAFTWLIFRIAHVFVKSEIIHWKEMKSDSLVIVCLVLILASNTWNSCRHFSLYCDLPDKIFSSEKENSDSVKVKNQKLPPTPRLRRIKKTK
jgi:hypothetical protein